MRLSLDEFSLPKFHALFGISNIKSTAVTAFRSHQPQRFLERCYSSTSGHDRSFTGLAVSSEERIPLSSLEIITDALLEIIEGCSKFITSCTWLPQWTEMSRSFAFRYNPALQPRSIIVFGCISKSVTDKDVKQLLRILVKALESFQDLQLIDAIIMGLTRLQPLLHPDSPIHRALFWVAISVLQLDEVNLYASGLALLEQNLHTLDSQGIFETNSLEQVMMATREPLEWHFKQLDHSVGLSFKSNFHFALIGHLIKGFRHPTPTTVSRTTRILNTILTIQAKSEKRDKFEVTKNNVAYLAALMPVSDEVQSRCHLKHRVIKLQESKSYADLIQARCATGSGKASPLTASSPTTHRGPPHAPSQPTSPTRPKVWASASNSSNENVETAQQPAPSITRPTVAPGSPKDAPSRSLDTSAAGTPSEAQRPLFRSQRSSSVPTPNSSNGSSETNIHEKGHVDKDGRTSPDGQAAEGGESKRPVNNEDNVLLDPNVLTDFMTQSLVLTVFVSNFHLVTQQLRNAVVTGYFGS